MRTVLERRAAFARAALLLALLATALWPIAPPPASATPASSQSSPVATPLVGDAVRIVGLVDRPGPVSVADLQALPSETVEVTYETRGGPEQHTFIGTRLYGVLEGAGPTVSPDERNPWLTRYVVITANDGYQVVLSGGEIDPDFGNAPILLAWEQDGQPLTGDDAPVRLVVPGDTRGGRYVFGVAEIEVRSTAQD